MDYEIDDVLFNKFYDTYKPVIDKKLSRIILNLFEKDKLNFESIYVITLRNGYNIKDIIYKVQKKYVNDKIRRRYIADGNRILTFDAVCKKILNEHYKTAPVCNFGFNNKLCFDYRDLDISINIYFKILE
jgi:hypothetical protein